MKMVSHRCGYHWSSDASHRPGPGEVLISRHPTVLGAARQRFFVNFKCDFAEELVTLVQRASRADDIDKGMLCRAAIGVIDNPPRHEDLAAIAGHLCQAVFDRAQCGAPRLRLENAIRSDLCPIPDRD